MRIVSFLFYILYNLYSDIGVIIVESICIILLVGLLMVVLYNLGYIGITTKSALVFIGSMPKKTSWKAKFSECTGHLRRVIRFDDCKRYEFSLNVEIEKGEFSVEIFDASKQLVLTLDSKNFTGIIDVHDNKKYYMSVKMESCTGNYEVSWR